MSGHLSIRTDGPLCALLHHPLAVALIIPMNCRYAHVPGYRPGGRGTQCRPSGDLRAPTVNSE